MELARRAARRRCGEHRSASAPQLLGIVRADHAALVRGQVEGDEVCEIAGLGSDPGACGARVARRVGPEAGAHQGRRRDERHPPRPRANRRAEDRHVVEDPAMHRDRLHTRATHRVRPPRRMEQDPPHPPRRRRRRSAATTTTSRPTSDGHSSKAPANAPWSHPTTPATPRTNPNSTSTRWANRSLTTKPRPSAVRPRTCTRGNRTADEPQAVSQEVARRRPRGGAARTRRTRCRTGRAWR